jgi:antimicrobial peptide system SdpA family protein
VVTLTLGVLLASVVTLSGTHLLPDGTRPYLGHLFPEGWKLFAIDPETPRFRAAVFRDGRWHDAQRLPLSKPSNAFGLNRSVRWQAVEIPRLVNEVPDLSSWTPCRRQPFRCLDVAGRRTHRVANQTPYSSLCGRVGLIRGFLVPPGRSSAGDDATQITHVVVLDVRC